jgi:hypothetical protein
MMKNVAPQTFPTAGIWNVQSIYDEKFGPETSPGACTWAEQLKFMMKKVFLETLPTACTWPLQSIYMMKKFGPGTFPAACT